MSNTTRQVRSGPRVARISRFGGSINGVRLPPATVRALIDEARQRSASISDLVRLALTTAFHLPDKGDTFEPRGTQESASGQIRENIDEYVKSGT